MFTFTVRLQSTDKHREEVQNAVNVLQVFRGSVHSKSSKKRQIQHALLAKRLTSLYLDFFPLKLKALSVHVKDELSSNPRFV